MRNKSLSQREKDFCRFFAMCGNSEEAAVKAGYTKNPQKEGERLICRSDICDEIASLGKQNQKIMQSLAQIGYQRLAFGNIADAVSLLFMENPPSEQLKDMDLFSVSEIKKPKDGAMEIKFFDRLKALEKFEILSLSSSGDKNPLYEALNKGAEKLGQGGITDED